ncbi:SWIM zinc finger family protein [Dactylosporangium sucinum]|uniref:SWIM-type domain-containing protein n=1 Tax=Dactylosporangium sucinum TaxID=1424081 RepID=A0A917TUL7_9ACTN|nr:SWIM zinc finger family protein [Dactylosporangium sucinum]GGM38191.1 hypothetical protein GCM10007977_044640 [Dactylosporangium sucinum]
MTESIHATSWSHQFLTMLESLRMGTTFQQGRRYARAGHVRSVTISTSIVTALVVDEDGETYRARVGVRAFSEADWSRIERALAREAFHVAKLLAGQLPDDLDEILGGFGLSLFPQSLADIVLDCSCPGWQKPCRHLAAACYVLAESFDADPFGLLAWRGRGREELLDRLREHRTTPADDNHGTADAPPTGGFWTAGPRMPAPEPPVAGAVQRPDALLDRLDPLPLTVGRFDVTDVLRAAYRTLPDGLPER